MVSLYSSEKPNRRLVKSDDDRFYIIDTGVTAAIDYLAGINAKYVISADRQSNDLNTYNEVILTLMKRGATKKTVIVCIGGGTVYALGGFVAATFLGGVRWVYVPTTFTGLFECSVGIKSGLIYEGRNCLIASERLPEYVYWDKNLLAAQPDGAKRGGLCRIVRLALLDKKLMAFVKKNIYALCSYDAEAMENCLPLYRRAMAKYVSRDSAALKCGSFIGDALYKSDGGKRNYGEYLIFGVILETCVFKSDVKRSFYDLETLLLDKLNLEPLDFSVENVVKFCFEEQNPIQKVPIITNLGKISNKKMTESAMLSLLNQFKA